MPLWLIQTCQLVSKCFFILVYVVNINNAHAGLSLTSVLAKSNMDGFTSCARLSPRPFFLSLPLLSTSSSLFYPFPPLSVPVSERRRMALTPSLIERCGPSAVIGGAAVVGFLLEVAAAWSIQWMAEVGRHADRAASPTAPDSSMKAEPQSTGCPFTRTIVKCAGRPRALRTRNHPVKS